MKYFYFVVNFINASVSQKPGRKSLFQLIKKGGEQTTFILFLEMQYYFSFK